MKKETSHIQKIEKILESDDELPMSYCEDLVLPSYENDNRFDTITFKWLDDPVLQSYFYQKHMNDMKHKNKDAKKVYIRKGFLNKHDLFCLKCIADSLGDNTVLWFADFLVRKDLQSKYMKRFKGCLVNNFVTDNNTLHFTNDDNNNIDNLSNKKLYKIKQL